MILHLFWGSQPRRCANSKKKFSLLMVRMFTRTKFWTEDHARSRLALEGGYSRHVDILILVGSGVKELQFTEVKIQ